jgi:hypothetical protein
LIFINVIENKKERITRIMCRLAKYFIIFTMAKQSFGISEKYIYFAPLLPLITSQPYYINDDINDDMNTMIDHEDNYMTDLE